MSRWGCQVQRSWLFASQSRYFLMLTSTGRMAQRGRLKRPYSMSNTETMTKTFADYVATQDARNMIQLNVHKYTLMLCDALELDFKTSHPNSDPYKFYIESGRKYHKVIMETNGQSRSVHALLIRRLVKFTNQHHSKHLQRLFVTIFLWLSLVSNAISVQIGRRLSLCSMNFSLELLTNRTNLLPFVMITSKKMMLNVMKKCDEENTLTIEEKFQVFDNICAITRERRQNALQSNSQRVSPTFFENEVRS